MSYKNIRLKIIFFVAFIIFCKIGLVSGDEVDYKSKGFTAYANEDYKTAIEMFKKEIQIHPKNFMAYYFLGDAHIYEKDFNAALNYFYKGMEINPTNPSLLFGIAGIRCDHYGSGPLQDAKQCLDISLKAASLPGLNNFSNAAYFYIFVIDSYISLGDLDKAKEWAYKQLNAFPDAVGPKNYYLDKITGLQTNAQAKEYHDQGLKQYDQKKYEAAILMWKKEIEINPKNPWPYYDIGLCYAKLQRYKESIPYHKKAIELALPDVRAHAELAATYNWIGDRKKAEEVVMDAMKKHPYDKRTLALVESYSDATSITHSMIEKFKEQFAKKKDEREQKIRQIDKQTQSALQETFYIEYYKEILLTLLVFALLLFLYFKPWHAYYLYAGDRHFKAMRYKDAAEFYEKLFGIRNGKFIPYHKLKDTYLKLGRKDEKAIFVFEKIYKENPEDREVISALANAYALKEK